MFSKLKTDKSQLGIYWGKDAFAFVESVKDQPDKTAYVRFDSKIPGDTGQKIPENLRLTALIQQAIREKKFTSKKAVLSLSAKDVIYRSFVIPFMKPEEVKNVVDFEITKYIPIKLEELTYTYHIVPFNEGDQKNLRVLFVAARKVVVEKYVGVLHQSGLEVDYIEPSSVSLIRILQKTNQLPKQNPAAVIEIESDGGKIIVIDKDVVQFVREFQSVVEGSGSPTDSSKFFNDVRVSFNFYQRQNPQGRIDRIFALTLKDFPQLSAGLNQEFKINSIAITPDKILKSAQLDELVILHAAGASVRDRQLSSKNFDLTVKSQKSSKQTLLDNAGPLAEWDLKRLSLSLLFSGFLIGGVLFYINLANGNTDRKYTELKAKLGLFESSTQDKLNELRDGAVQKLNQYRDVRVNSQFDFLLKKIPELLLPGAWVTNFAINYDDNNFRTDSNNTKSAKIKLAIDGYVYLQNQNDQIRLVNSMYYNFKNDKELAKYFDEIVLETVKQDFFNNNPVTYYRITCK